MHEPKLYVILPKKHKNNGSYMFDQIDYFQKLYLLKCTSSSEDLAIFEIQKFFDTAETVTVLDT